MPFSSKTVSIAGISHKMGTMISNNKEAWLPAYAKRGSRPYGPPDTVKKIMAARGIYLSLFLMAQCYKKIKDKLNRKNNIFLINFCWRMLGLLVMLM